MSVLPERSASTTSPVPRIGFWMATALVVGNMVGSGIFLLPSALSTFGADNLPGWTLTALGGITLGAVFARLSGAIPGAGGPYTYTRTAFGDLAGFAVAWGYWVSIWVGNAAIGTAAVGYAGEFVPWMVRTPLNSALTTLGFLWAITLVNCAGIRATGWVQGITTVIKLVPLVVAVALLVPALRGFDWTTASGARFTVSGTAGVATLALWAMLGLESATIPADKVKGAADTVGRATLWGTIGTVAITAAACSSVLLLVPAARLGGSGAPFAELIRPVWGEVAARAVSACAAISALGALNGWILLQGELPRAMAADGLFLRAFARTSPRGAPVVALISTSGLVTVLVLLNLHRTLVGVFTFFVLLSTTATLVAYLACSLALIRLHRGAGAKGMALLGALGAIYSLAALAGAGKEAVLWGAALLLAAVPLRLIGDRANVAARAMTRP